MGCRCPDRDQNQDGKESNGRELPEEEELEQETE